MTTYILKMVLAFLLALVCALVLYPVVRAVKRGVGSLVASASGFAFVLLILLAVPRGPAGIKDVVIYATGIFFGVILISVFMSSGSRWLEEEPADDVLMKPHVSRHGMHLRQLLQMGVMMEERSRDFYLSLAGVATEEGVRRFCAELAAEEVLHRRLLESILSRWMALKRDGEVAAELEKKLKAWDIFTWTPEPAVTERELLGYAMEQERRMADFYQAFETSFPESWKRMHVRDLVGQERAHEAKIGSWLGAER